MAPAEYLLSATYLIGHSGICDIFVWPQSFGSCQLAAIYLFGLNLLAPVSSRERSVYFSAAASDRGSFIHWWGREVGDGGAGGCRLLVFSCLCLLLGITVNFY